MLLWLLIAIQACENDPTPEIPVGSAGYFVVNEGGFGNSNTSISFYDREKDVMTNDVFAAKNGRALGDQAQSLTVFEGNAYVVVQHSAKVEVINADDFSSVKTISDDIESPRYFLGISSTKGYLSDWGADGMTGTVKVINLDNFTVTKTIPTGKGANKMLLKDGKVYVANSGGFDNDNTISIIDTSTDAVTSTITVGDNPNSLQFDKDGNLWVASAGKFVYNEDYSVNEELSTKSTISKVTNGTEVSRFPIDGIIYPGVAHLSINKAGDKLYYLFSGAVYSLSVSATAAPANPLVGDKYFYGLAVDPFNDDVLACEAPDFSSAGKVYVYRADAQLFKSYNVGIAPNGIGFK
jgi:YVTN family beta-propeller protein